MGNNTTVLECSNRTRPPHGRVARHRSVFTADTFWSMAAADADLTAMARIRNAALELLSRRGFAATSIRDVAAEAGVSAGLVQHYFPTKVALREAVDDHVIALVTDTFGDTLAASRDKDVLVDLGDRVTQFVKAHGSAMRYVARGLADSEESALALFDIFIDVATAQWRQLDEDGVLRQDADLVWASLHVVMLNFATVLFEDAVSRHLPRPFFDDREIERWNRVTTEFFRSGLLNQSGGRGRRT